MRFALLMHASAELEIACAGPCMCYSLISRESDDLNKSQIGHD